MSTLQIRYRTKAGFSRCCGTVVSGGFEGIPGSCEDDLAGECSEDEESIPGLLTAAAASAATWGPWGEWADFFTYSARGVVDDMDATFTLITFNDATYDDGSYGEQQIELRIVGQPVPVRVYYVEADGGGETESILTIFGGAAEQLSAAVGVSIEFRCGTPVTLAP